MNERVTDYGDFTDLLEETDVIDNRYPVKGCCVWMPYGFRLKTRVFNYIKARFRAAGYRECDFPRLVQGESVRKVADEIKDFRKGLFWLREYNNTPLDVFLNPTGECGVYTMFNTWINHESDLPLRLFQHDSTYRPHDDPKVLLNGDEFTDLVEAHAAFPTPEDANAEIKSVKSKFDEIHDALGIPYLPLKRPRVGNNPVYEGMYSYESYLPAKGKSFNIGVLYNQQQIYSKPFDVTFSDQDGNVEYTYQVTFGIAERAIAAMLDLHRDEHGLRVLPRFAPTQLRIIPVYGGIENDRVDEYAERIVTRLPDSVRADVDDRDSNAGKRLAEGRQKGIPVRIGVSAQNVENEDVRVFLRTREDPITGVGLSELSESVEGYLDEVSKTIISDAEERVHTQIEYCDSVEDATAIAADGKIVELHWCSSRDCLMELDESVPGEMLGRHEGEDLSGNCLVCSKSVNTLAYFGLRVDSP